jgi:hypothetical protein
MCESARRASDRNINDSRLSKSNRRRRENVFKKILPFSPSPVISRGRLSSLSDTDRKALTRTMTTTRRDAIARMASATAGLLGNGYLDGLPAPTAAT